jgi:hypothetical protein
MIFGDNSGVIIRGKGKVNSFAIFNSHNSYRITSHLMMKDGRSFTFICNRFAAYHGMRLEFELPMRAGVRRVLTFDYPAKNQLKQKRK